MAMAARCTAGVCCSPGMTTHLPAFAFRSAAIAERNLPDAPAGGCAPAPPAPTAAAHAAANDAISLGLRASRCSALNPVVLGALSTAYNRFMEIFVSVSLRREA